MPNNITSLLPGDHITFASVNTQCILMNLYKNVFVQNYELVSNMSEIGAKLGEIDFYTPNMVISVPQ